MTRTICLQYVPSVVPAAHQSKTGLHQPPRPLPHSDTPLVLFHTLHLQQKLSTPEASLSQPSHSVSSQKPIPLAYHTRHLVRRHPKHTSLCQSKTSRPLVSSILGACPSPLSSLTRVATSPPSYARQRLTVYWNPERRDRVLHSQPSFLSTYCIASDVVGLPYY